MRKAGDGDDNEPSVRVVVDSNKMFSIREEDRGTGRWGYTERGQDERPPQEKPHAG